jgi:hypothetical protein
MHRISPSGIFSSYLFLCLRWFLFLIALVGVFMLPLWITAHFIDSVMAMFESAAHHFLLAVWDIVVACILLALLIAALVVLCA